jgi:hypothetical protein
MYSNDPSLLTTEIFTAFTTSKPVWCPIDAVSLIYTLGNTTSIVSVDPTNGRTTLDGTLGSLSGAKVSVTTTEGVLVETLPLDISVVDCTPELSSPILSNHFLVLINVVTEFSDIELGTIFTTSDSINCPITKVTLMQGSSPYVGSCVTFDGAGNNNTSWNG